MYDLRYLNLESLNLITTPKLQVRDLLRYVNRAVSRDNKAVNREKSAIVLSKLLTGANASAVRRK